MERRAFLGCAGATASTGCLTVLESHSEQLGYGERYRRPDGVELMVNEPYAIDSIDFGMETFTPEEGNVFVVAPVTVVNDTEDPITPPGLDDYTAEEDRSPPFSRGTMSMEDSYRTTSIQPGESRRGNVVFELEGGIRAPSTPVHYEHTMWRWSATWSADA